MGKRAKIPRSKLNARLMTITARKAHFPDPPKGTVFNPDVNPDFKDQHLSVYGHRLMSNRDLRVVEVAEILMDWASDDNQPNGLRSGFPEDSARGINLVIDDFEAVSRRHTEDSEDAFTIFVHEWKWRPPILESFRPMEVGRWELEVYDILYNYCLRPVEFNSLTMNRFIAWLCSNGSVPKSFRTRVERECLSRGGIKYSEFLAIIRAYVDHQPEEINRKARLSEFFANNEPPRLKAIGLNEFDQYKRDVIGIAQTNRDILLLWDEEFVHWLRRGFVEFPVLNALIARRAFELAIRLDETAPPSCKAINLLFGDLLVVIEDHITNEHQRQALEHKIHSLQSQLRIEHQRPLSRVEFSPEPENDDSADERELEEMLSDILNQEKELYHQRIQIQKDRDDGRTTIEDQRQLLLLHKKELRCTRALDELRQAQAKRTEKYQRKPLQRQSPHGVVQKCEQGAEPHSTVLREIFRPQQHHIYSARLETSQRVRPGDKLAETHHDPDYERLQRCRMAEIRRQKLTRGTAKAR
ncbi:hypothetical protein AUEXF2481DRAFT_152616 [Aureobasidium subglaciale EXF-2481]|uniref:Uncharacterized protein n=1 Tax=Aureobasidium subglaciale (strain EXF-2481) TaxID=1043005 RepID=A0A074YX34_AURSE|nr:uncharacterized protein AUEXF2481DRAFT_152616 [Aureobasidium subglaciale EXF-2481]KAI5210219.1 hypothetical protein E4T38_02082 [Aureobasidium subglaciale]KAI5228950.1 hypothetical protein E4T40_01812 [Aureobasidium subglaciale]KAI5232720.1 hypothetical protein E4T41_02032 [Aureobasidium subglaciale]KAI5266108.1 hypothetical protein E4T46_01859 [Aureobasidium subglaciale]KER00705.1 hypothetical protein AUEXF2481DRAFT_152616 [Aureobasidium subglaciale EXF-2481]